MKHVPTCLAEEKYDFPIKHSIALLNYILEFKGNNVSLGRYFLTTIATARAIIGLKKVGFLTKSKTQKGYFDFRFQ